METKHAREFEGWTRKSVGEGDDAHEVYERVDGIVTCTVDAEVVRSAEKHPATTATITAGIVETGYSNTLHDRCVQRIVAETEGVFTEEARDILRMIASELEDTGAPAHLRVAAELRGKS